MVADGHGPWHLGCRPKPSRCRRRRDLARDAAGGFYSGDREHGTGVYPQRLTGLPTVAVDSYQLVAWPIRRAIAETGRKGASLEAFPARDQRTWVRGAWASPRVAAAVPLMHMNRGWRARLIPRCQQPRRRLKLAS